MSNDNKFEIEITDENGNVLGAVEFEGVFDALVINVTSTPALPVRSPLHANALNLEDLEVGMIVASYNINGYFTDKRVVITGQPFRRNEKYSDPWMGESMMVPAAMVGYNGKLHHMDLFLSDMGIVPYERAANWNTSNYTVAVS